MEEGVAAAGVRAAYILRPPLLKGERDEFRLAERIGNRALSIVGPLMAGPLRKYRAVPTETVARVMLACALSPARTSLNRTSSWTSAVPAQRNAAEPILNQEPQTWCRHASGIANF
jgi:uncharacterized protein YbjT (DUF2867 family)